MKVIIAGRGKVGRGLKRALGRGQVQERLVRGRSLTGRQARNADVVVLAVPDDAIASCAHRIAADLRPPTVVVHCAGARGLDPLDACQARGIPVAVMHPMASFADPKRPPKLEGTTLVTYGNPAAVRAVRQLARAMGTRVAVANVHGPAYHAAAVLVANASAALADTAVGLLGRLGMGPKDAVAAVAGLLRTVADNVERVGVPGALTGPVARGDVQTVRAHRAALGAIDRRAADTYDRITPTIVQTATAAGLPQPRAAAIKRALGGKPKPKPKTKKRVGSPR